MVLHKQLCCMLIFGGKELMKIVHSGCTETSWLLLPELFVDLYGRNIFIFQTFCCTFQ